MGGPGRHRTPVYAARTAFAALHSRSQRWAIVVTHRRAGKTVASVNDLIFSASKECRPDGRYAYIAPYFNQAKDIAWVYLKQYAEPLLSLPPNETELRVD